MKTIAEEPKPYLHSKELSDFNQLMIKVKLHLCGHTTTTIEEIEPLAKNIRKALESCKENIRLRY